MGIGSAPPERPASTKRWVLSAALLVIALVLLFGLQSIEAQAGYSGLSARFLPVVVLFGLALGAIALALSPDTSLTPEDGHPPSAQKAGLAWVLAGLVLHLSLIGWIGFVLASALLLAFIARGFGSQSWHKNAFIGAFLALPVWLLFTKVLGIGLPLFPLIK